MKRIIILPIIMFLIATVSSFAGNCKWDSYFKYPKHGQTYQAGKDVYTLIYPKYKHHIAYMQLYINGKYIRKESSYPFEWCKGGGNSDHYLRNMKPGTYKLKAKIKDKCGYTHYIYCTFYVKGGGGGGNNYCKFNNPLYDLHWLKNLHKKYPNYTICMYKKNGKVLFKVYPCGKSHYTVYWYNCEGHLICKTTNGSSCSSVHGAKFYKCYYKGCNGGGGNPGGGHCEGDAWYKYPKQYKTYPKYSDVYVRVDPKKYHDIAFMELYVNGKYVRKESKYPYEWCKGNGNSDHRLRDMKPGSYKLECRIKTKCGKWYKEFTHFYVK